MVQEYDQMQYVFIDTKVKMQLQALFYSSNHDKPA